MIILSHSLVFDGAPRGRLELINKAGATAGEASRTGQYLSCDPYYTSCDPCCTYCVNVLIYITEGLWSVLVSMTTGFVVNS